MRPLLVRARDSSKGIYMNKLILTVCLALLPLMSSPVQAAPSFSGTVTLDFAALGIGSGSTTLDWAVYAPSDTGAVAGVSADYTYQYTLHGWSGYTGTFASDIYRSEALTTGSGTSTSGTTATVAAIADGFPGVFGFDTDAAAPFSSTSQTTTGWFTSKFGPVTSTFDVTLDRTAWVASGASIMTDGTGPGGISGTPLAPGVPEPQTWALLLTMMGFTTWWMGRRRDDDAPLQTSITA